MKPVKIVHSKTRQILEERTKKIPESYKMYLSYLSVCVYMCVCGGGIVKFDEYI